MFGRETDSKNAMNDCSKLEPLLLMAASGEELSQEEQALVGAHLVECTDCAAALERDKQLLATFAENKAQPDAALLAECRLNLQDALDREEEHGWLYRLVGGWVPSSWIAPRPAWSAAILLIIGFSVGIFGPHLLLDGRAPNAPAKSGNSLNASVTATPDESNNQATALSHIDFHPADVAGMNVFPSGSSNLEEVQLRMNAAQPFTVQGTVDDGNVRAALLHILDDKDAFGPEMRLQAVDLLRERNNDAEIRKALCHTVHQDGNAAVRLKALEALDGSEPRDIVRQTLLDALVDDQNPGVRVEAINELRTMMNRGQVVSDDRILSVLQERVDRDPNTYIRLQSAAAIRELGAAPRF